MAKAFSIQATNIFAHHCTKGLWLIDSTDTLQEAPLCSYGQVSNLYVDTVEFGIFAESTFNATGGRPGWTINNFYAAGNADVPSRNVIALSPGGIARSQIPAIHVVGGSIWGDWQGPIVSKGLPADVYTNVGWQGGPP